LASPEEQNIIKNAIFNYAKDSGLWGLEVFNLADTKIIFKVT
jgi:hypothetical protein